MNDSTLALGLAEALALVTKTQAALLAAMAEHGRPRGNVAVFFGHIEQAGHCLEGASAMLLALTPVLQSMAVAVQELETDQREAEQSAASPSRPNLRVVE
jgi:hypothetical protein